MTSRLARPLLLAALLVTAGPALGEDAQGSSELALQQTLELLKNPEQRREALKNDPAAQAADARARELAGSDANTEALYALAAEVMASLTRQAGGDAQKLQQLLQEAQKNPAAFAEKLTPEQRAQLERLADQSPQKAR